MGVHLVKYDQGYIVFDGESRIGAVAPVWLASHIRRGRAQTSPWWTAQDAYGTPVAAPDPLRVGQSADRWQTRAEAIAALVARLEPTSPPAAAK